MSDSAKSPSDNPNEPGLAVVLRTIDERVGLVEQGLLLLLLVVLTAVGSYAAIFGIVYEGGVGTWTGELVTYCVFFIAMAGSALAAQKSQLIAMDVVTRFLTPKTQAWIRILTNLFAITVTVLLAYRGLDVYDVIAGEKKHYDIIPPAAGSLALPIGAGAIALHLLFHSVIELSYLVRGDIAPQDTTLKAH